MDIGKGVAAAMLAAGLGLGALGAGVASAQPTLGDPGKPGQFGQPPGQFTNVFAKKPGSVPSQMRDKQPPGSFVSSGFPPQGPCQAGCGGGA